MFHGQVKWTILPPEWLKVFILVICKMVLREIIIVLFASASVVHSAAARVARVAPSVVAPTLVTAPTARDRKRGTKSLTEEARSRLMTLRRPSKFSKPQFALS